MWKTLTNILVNNHVTNLTNISILCFFTGRPVTDIPPDQGKMRKLYYSLCVKREQTSHSNFELYFQQQKVKIIELYFSIDHIANLQNYAWWEGKGLIWCIVGRKRFKSVPLTFPPCIILEIRDMVCRELLIWKNQWNKYTLPIGLIHAI